jgi:hypothetical protein
MDEFSWGNTRVVIGEGKDKKVITNEDEKFDDSMIPVKKFSGTYFLAIDLSIYIYHVRQNMRRKLGKLERDILTIQDMTVNPARDRIPDHVLRHLTPQISTCIQWRW